MRALAVRDGAAFDLRQDLLYVLIVQAQESRAVKRDFVDELGKRFADFLDAGVMVEMLAIDVGDDRENWRQLQERTIAFVRFHHQKFALADTRVGTAHGGDFAAHDHRRIQARKIQNRRNHRRRRRLAMAPADRDSELQAHQFGQQFTARDHGNLQAPRFLDLGIAFVYRGGNHHRLRTAHVSRCMPFENTRAERRQTRCNAPTASGRTR